MSQRYNRLTDRLSLDLADAYRVTAALRRLREGRGERVVGRKIGFTNERMWAEYGVTAPIWGYMYTTTVHRSADLLALDAGSLVEPRIEPEIVFALSRSPEAGMDERALLACVKWVAHGLEVVQSLYPGWRFRAADTVAAHALHGTLLVGSPKAVKPENRDEWHEHLAAFEITLLRDGMEVDRGRAANVLGGGPLTALRHLVDLLARDPVSPRLGPNEIISTGTLTRALPVAPGERWSTALSGLPLPGATLRLT